MDGNDERVVTTAAAGNVREGDTKRTWSKPVLHKLPLQEAMLTLSNVFSDGILYS